MPAASGSRILSQSQALMTTSARSWRLEATKIIDALTQPSRQFAEPGEFEALALPCFDREDNPKEEHGQRCQDAGQEKNHGCGNVGHENGKHRQHEEDCPDQDALPGVKADKAMGAKGRKEQ